MRIIVTGRHVDLTDAFKAMVEDKSRRLDRFYDGITEIDAVVSRESGQHEVELIVRADHRNQFVAKERHVDAQAAFDLVIERLGRQLARHKERLRNRKHPGRGPGEARGAGRAAD